METHERRLWGHKFSWWLLKHDGPRWGMAETIALLVWCGVAGFAVTQHVPWADEAQAWMLADEVSWKTLFLHSLHYEGSGGLWHAFLKVLQTLHVPFNGMRWIVAGVQGAAMAILLRYAPFPRAVRLLLPFTFFFLFQDAVVARSYCLFAILAFPAAALLRNTRPRPVALALLLGLLANLSVHGVLLSGGLAVVAWIVWGRRFVRNAPAIGLLIVLWTVAAYSMVPARDVDFSAGNNLHRSLAKVEKTLGIQSSAPPPVAGLPMVGLQPTPAPVHVRHGAAKVWSKAARILGVVTFPLSKFRVLALMLVLAIAAQAWAIPRRQKSSTQRIKEIGLVGLLPYGLMVLVFSSLYLAPRHAGTLLAGFVVGAWLTWPRQPASQSTLFQAWAERVATLLFLLVCVEQIGWSVHAIVEEHRSPYAPAAMTAHYLKSQGIGAPNVGPETGKLVAGYYYFSMGPLLYFDRNIYFNQPPHRYWYWSTLERNYSTVWDALARHPDFVVVGTFEGGPDAEVTRDWTSGYPPEPGMMRGDGFGVTQYFEAHGYRQTHVFCGHSWMRASYAELLCDTVLEPVK